MKNTIKLMIPILSLTLLGSCGINKYRYEDHERYTSGSDFTLTEEVKEIEVNWINGDITIVQGETTSISVKEENYEDHPLYYFLDGTTLNIKYVEYGTSNSEINALEKDLTIMIPTTLPDIEIDMINGECNFALQTLCNDVTVNLINGNINICSISADEIELDTVNGNINIESINATSLSIDKVNGNSNIKNITKAISIDINAVNGIDTICVPESLGYKVEHDSIGTFTSDYDNSKTYGDKLVDIEYDGANGILNIKKQ